jgi:ABC-type cobalt transport system substrate-binding protein
MSVTLLPTSDFFLSILFNIFQRPFGSVLDFFLGANAKSHSVKKTKAEYKPWFDM